MNRFMILIAAFLIAASQPVMSEPATCDVAALQASKLTDVPLQVLLAVTRVETGRARNSEIEPWPWTANVAGQGYWFDDPTTAKFFLKSQLSSGVRSFDVGCFQLNYRWHGKAFSSIDRMLNPEANALYAAQFLADLHAEFGSWEKAVGAYHSRTRVYAEKYLRRFRQIHATLLLQPPQLEAQVRVSTKSAWGGLYDPHGALTVSTRGSLWKN